MTLRDAYTVLGLKPGCPDEDVTKVFRQKALKFHPDRGGDPDKFRHLVEAKDTILKRSKITVVDSLADILSKMNAQNIKNRTYNTKPKDPKPSDDFENVWERFQRWERMMKEDERKRKEQSKLTHKVLRFRFRLFIVWMVKLFFIKVIIKYIWGDIEHEAMISGLFFTLLFVLFISAGKLMKFQTKYFG